MKYIMKVTLPTEKSNESFKDGSFGKVMQEILSEIKPEAVYFTTICGDRGAYIVVNLHDASEMPAKAEPFFLKFNAEVNVSPVMTPDDLAKADASIQAAVKKWGK
ncbi:MAG: hypothetical protein NTW49_03505 [Bacteroidia bacterium]|nr:hypothetical protein [Bacteroidia bacterium]